MKKILTVLMVLFTLGMMGEGWAQGRCLLIEQLIKKHCTIKSGLQQTQAPFASCTIAIQTKSVPLPLLALFEKPWQPDWRQRVTHVPAEASMTGQPMTLPSWTEGGIGDEAFLTPCYEPSVSRTNLEGGCFNFYIKRGNQLYQFVSYGKKETGTDDLCGVQAIKKIAQDLWTYD